MCPTGGDMQEPVGRSLARACSILNIGLRATYRRGPMRYMSRSTAIVSALLLLGASAASAQHPQTRKGFWIGFGLGYGSLSCTGCSSTGGVSGYLKLGGTVSPHLLLGGETNGWTTNVNGYTLTAGNASFGAYYYPTPAAGFLLGAGGGLSAHTSTWCGTRAAQSGLGATVGLGYDVRVGANTSITPVFN